MKRMLLIACLVFDMIWITAIIEKGISSTKSHIVVPEKGGANGEQWITLKSGMYAQSDRNVCTLSKLLIFKNR